MKIRETDGIGNLTRTSPRLMGFGCKVGMDEFKRLVSLTKGHAKFQFVDGENATPIRNQEMHSAIDQFEQMINEAEADGTEKALLNVRREQDIISIDAELVMVPVAAESESE